jgi:hypothetical protein
MEQVKIKGRVYLAGRRLSMDPGGTTVGLQVYTISNTC